MFTRMRNAESFRPVRRCCTAVAILVAAVHVGFAAASQVEAVHTGIEHQAYFGIDFRGERGLAVGTGGALLETDDGGTSWRSLTQDATRLSLFDVTIGPERTLVSGQMGTILVGHLDGTWRAVKAPTDMRLLAIDQNSGGLAVAVGQFGTILRSRDGGDTWQSVAPPWEGYTEHDFEPQLYDVVVDERGRVTVVGEFGLILRSDNQGDDWRLLWRAQPPEGDVPAPALWALTLGDDGTGYAVGQEGVIVKTDDDGRTWRKLESGTGASLQGVHVESDGRVLAIGIRELIESRDSGTTWRHIDGEDIATEWYQGLASPASGSMTLAVGHSGRVLRIRR
ncbi:WD40/YVTN/BNR-like repeat-containing protein [Sinimarinibacterium sp. CAU 1509]|uniref:WD40/YVTN/BNR-like repeat-containing protein n=1 Tax=Sinimarinibacterium sp. CAU 1509 TaxID=2562283 RepID=UPI00146D6197|nr:YCF48-related protein [Sinimarinibacterium sp. CAU 1509]